MEKSNKLDLTDLIGRRYNDAAKIICAEIYTLTGGE